MVIGMAAALLLPATLPAQAASETLRIAIEGEYPPFNQTDKKGNLSGFDVEIANALCQAMQAPCKLVKQSWDRMIPDLVAGKYDLVVSSMSVTASRRQKIDFTNAYYQTPAKFVAKKGTPIEVTPAGLKGRKVGVQRATTHEQFLSGRFGSSAVLVRYETLPKAQADLVAGKLDLVFADAMALNGGFLKTAKGKDFAFVGPDFRDQRWFGQGIAIGVQKGQGDLVAQLNQALAKIRADGSYDSIASKYFDFDLLAREVASTQ
jgi:arginine/ornithine transport system substrate-binding protein